MLWGSELQVDTVRFEKKFLRKSVLHLDATISHYMLCSLLILGSGLIPFEQNWGLHVVYTPDICLYHVHCSVSFFYLQVV